MRAEQVLASMITGYFPFSEAFISAASSVLDMPSASSAMPLLASIWPQHSLSKPSGRMGA